jgi:flavin reductase (DIM6/NTAB) family NADH-FMN oxidoreductase RutF
MQPSNEYGDWILLTERKQWSRLLYTNPVCFLCCSSRDITTPTTATTTSSVVVVRHNAMVLSWLTPMNNTGGFVMSLNRRRHSVSMLQQSEGEASLFTLSVPIHGMERLVRLVGGTSGRHGNKFADESHLSRDSSHSLPGPADTTICCTSPMNAQSGGSDRFDAVNTTTESPATSKRQIKKRSRAMGAIPGLKAVPAALYEGQSDSLVCIQGTVAHLVCRVMSTVPGIDDFDQSRTGSIAMDDDALHILFIAQVEHASVRSMYWDSHKNLFRPSPHVPPYLSFFGSQTFGYVVTQDSLPPPSHASPTSTDLVSKACHP